jgi:CBS domain-containing protein
MVKVQGNATTVKDLLQQKGEIVWTVNPDTSLKEALLLMEAKHIGAVLVVQAEQPVGIFSERDYARKIVSDSRITMATPVKELMTHPIFYVTPEQTIEDCCAFMTAKHFRHLPVMDENHLAGIISIGDIVKQLILAREMTIKDLEDYIWVNMI